MNVVGTEKSRADLEQGTPLYPQWMNNIDMELKVQSRSRLRMLI